MSDPKVQIEFQRQPIVIVMGVSGAGKSTVGMQLAERLKLPFLDGDDYHPQDNVTKMSKGIALTDDDRWPWLSQYAHAMREAATKYEGVIGACSSLKRSYREYLMENVGLPFVFVYLDASRDLLLKRLDVRTDHFMPAELLDSQLMTLEIPEDDEPCYRVSVDNSVDRIVSQIEALVLRK